MRQPLFSAWARRTARRLGSLAVVPRVKNVLMHGYVGEMPQSLTAKSLLLTEPRAADGTSPSARVGIRCAALGRRVGRLTCWAVGSCAFLRASVLACPAHPVRSATAPAPTRSARTRGLGVTFANRVVSRRERSLEQGTYLLANSMGRSAHTSILVCAMFGNVVPTTSLRSAPELDRLATFGEIGDGAGNDDENERQGEEPWPPSVSCEEQVDLRCWVRHRGEAAVCSSIYLRAERGKLSEFTFAGLERVASRTKLIPQLPGV
ncbi:MAG: hypothetical protein QOF27_2542 [Gaiellaceae bacterium]|nr:hypothetical protein [Gaiellaceae bacterium]